MRAFSSDRIGRALQLPRKRKKKSKKRGVFRRLRRAVFFTCLAAFGLSILVVLPFRWINPPTTAFMLQDASSRDPLLHQWTDWDNIGTTLPTAMVAAEDQKFASHIGFDVKSIRESVEKYNDGEPLRGASTITQQVAKNMYLWSGRSFLRKSVEAYLTALIEAIYPKKRILEIYLNIAELGPGIYGVSAASAFYFKKNPVELNNAEAALLAAVLPNPKRFQVAQPTPYVRERQRWIAEQMRRLEREAWITALK